jgi:pyocin large subunit-like protein
METVITAFTRRLAWVAILSVLLSTAALAQKAQKENGREATAEEKAAFAEEVKKMVNRTTEGLEVKTLSNGTKYMDLKGHYQSVAVAKVNPDGTVSVGCVTNEKEVENFVKSAAQPQATKKQATKKPAPEVK